MPSIFTWYSNMQHWKQYKTFLTGFLKDFRYKQIEALMWCWDFAVVMQYYRQYHLHLSSTLYMFASSPSSLILSIKLSPLFLFPQHLGVIRLFFVFSSYCWLRYVCVHVCACVCLVTRFYWIMPICIVYHRGFAS